MAFTESRGHSSTSSCYCARSGNYNITGAAAASTTDDDQFHDDYSSSSTSTVHNTAPHYLLVIATTTTPSDIPHHYLLVINILIFKLGNITPTEHDIGKWFSFLVLRSETA